MKGKRKTSKNWPFRMFLMEKGINTARELAEKCGVSDAAIHNVISRRYEPSPHLLSLMCRALRCNPVELVEKLTGRGKE